MANTLTLDEFNNLKTKSDKIVYDKILQYYTARISGIDSCKLKVKELLLYAKTLSSWEQDKFNSLQYTNYLNSNAIQAIFKQVNKLS